MIFLPMQMSIPEALRYAVMGVVFVTAILAGLYVLVALLSKMIGMAERRRLPAALPDLPEPVKPEPVGSGFHPRPANIVPQVELIETDEATAAVLMAIVAEQSGIPPDRLDFKRIQLLNDGGTQ